MRNARSQALAISLIVSAIGSYGCPASKKQGCITGQITCDSNNQCDESGCTNGCCAPRAVDAGVDAGADGGCDNCVIPDAGPPNLQCITDKDCTSNIRPYCNTATNTCVNCIQSWQCPSAYDTCQANACAPEQTCSSNTDCTAQGAPYCILGWDICGECRTDLDCPVGQSCYQGICSTYQSCTNNRECSGLGGACTTLTNGNFTEYLFVCGSSPGSKGGGEACLQDSECASGWCEWDDSSQGEGFCLNACESDSDCGPDGWCPPDGVVPRELTGPDGRYSTGDEVYETVHVCMPKQCTANADCTDVGVDGGDGEWICGISPVARTSETVSGTATSWVQTCLPVFGHPGALPAGGPCGADHECASYRCLDGRCFDPCVTSADCVDDGGTCAPLGPDAGYVDVSGSPINSCTQ